MTRNIVLLLLLALAAFYFLFKRQGDTGSAEARRLVETGARLVDVRSPQEFATGHIPGAINIPVQELESRLSELDDKERPIVVYCRSGNRSSSATQMLKNAGYTKIHDLGAMSRW